MTDKLKRTVIEHIKKYPKAELQDILKMLYQNEFGGGHLVSDEAACLARLAAEYKSIEQSPDDSPEILLPEQPEKHGQCGGDVRRRP